jgi:hypothetical protein
MPPDTKAISESAIVQRVARRRFDRITQKEKSLIALPHALGKAQRPMPRRMARVPIASRR